MCTRLTHPTESSDGRRPPPQFPVLLGNTFPLTLVRRPVRIEPRTVEELRKEVSARGVASFWGHTNTLEAARKFLGFDSTPATARPALTLNSALLPCLDGQSFDEVWLLSPDYAPGFRPQIGQEVPADAIIGWQVLCLDIF